ncbi:MAG TPA: shikimate kinase [candidate division Zixibacteria bacterium]|nr:shikimate kinase [candidate division Zixibacteria bacterium]
MGNSNIIFLVGFSGSGKSTIGPVLAKRRRARFIDIDEIIESSRGISIADIFRLEGEHAFRILEKNTLRDVVTKAENATVIALGGGAVLNRENRQLMRASGIVVYLSCSIREICRRLSRNVDRPLLNVPPRKRESLLKARLRRITELLEKRRRYYQECDIRVSTTNKTITGVVNEIERLIKRFDECH